LDQAHRLLLPLLPLLARARGLAASLLVVLATGGIPGATLHVVDRELSAPPVPVEVTERDGALDVTVRGAAAQGLDAGDGDGGTEAVAGEPLAGASVRVFALIAGQAYLAGSGESDASGVVHFTGLPHGETWVLADAPGRARGSSFLVVESGARSLGIALGPEHTLEVAVHDEVGAAVAGAQLEVLCGSELLPVGARTDEGGVAHVGRLSAAPWHVTARAPGYEEEMARASRDGERLKLVLRKLGAIAVQVLGEDERPVAGAHVTIAGATLWPPRSAETAAGGDVLLGSLAVGSYAVRATAGDRVSPIEIGVMLARGEHKDLVLHLAPGRFVAVRVADGTTDDADPVRAARVTLVEGGISPFPLEATTDAKGRARLGPIASGSSTLGVRADGFVARGGLLVADPIPPETRVALVRAGTLEGRVLDARGYPVDGATLEIVGTDPAGAPILDDPRRASFQTAHFDAMLGGPAPMVPSGELGVVPGPVPAIPREGAGIGASVPPSLGVPGRLAEPAEPWVTLDDGTFRATPASPGRVRAIVHHPQFVEAQSDLVTLTPGGTAHVDIVMHAGGTLEGRVLDARDRPVSGARVFVSATHGSLERTTRTGTDGTFAFAAMPDEIVLTASVDEDDAQPDARMVVSVPEGGRKEVAVHLPAARDPLPVKVSDVRGRAVDTAQVSASSMVADIPLRTTTFTDRDGAAALKRARGVALRVEVNAPGFAPKVMTTDGTEAEIVVELSPAETAHGEVVAARGRDAVAGAEVTLTTDLGVRRVRTDSQGAYSLAGLAPGSGKLRVRAAGYAPVTRDVAIPDGGGRRAIDLPRIELAEEGGVEGTVVDGKGNPVPGARVARDHVPTWLAVGGTPQGIAVADAHGRFVLHELPEGTIALEAYAPDLGRARADGVKVVSGRTTVGVTIALTPAAGDDAPSKEPAASGNVAITLGESGAAPDVVVVSVAEGSEAERAGLAADDVLLAVDGTAVHSIHEARARLLGPLADDVVVTVRRGEQSLTLRVTREAVRR
jgi:protocatechuate 3,4-dioxygenase beta subunit